MKFKYHEPDENRFGKRSSFQNKFSSNQFIAMASRLIMLILIVTGCSIGCVGESTVTYDENDPVVVSLRSPYEGNVISEKDFNKFFSPNYYGLAVSKYCGRVVKIRSVTQPPSVTHLDVDIVEVPAIYLECMPKASAESGPEMLQVSLSLTPDVLKEIKGNKLLHYQEVVVEGLLEEPYLMSNASIVDFPKKTNR